mgnify:CR=1 FL=1
MSNICSTQKREIYLCFGANEEIYGDSQVKIVEELKAQGYVVDPVTFELEKDGEIISSGTVLFTVPKFFRFADPKLTVRVEGDEIVGRGLSDESLA